MHLHMTACIHLLWSLCIVCLPGVHDGQVLHGVKMFKVNTDCCICVVVNNDAAFGKTILGSCFEVVVQYITTGVALVIE